MSGASSRLWKKVWSILQYGQDVERRTKTSTRLSHFSG
jgi:hypothetical protein